MRRGTAFVGIAESYKAAPASASSAAAAAVAVVVAVAAIAVAIAAVAAAPAPANALDFAPAVTTTIAPVAADASYVLLSAVQCRVV
jgi:hypothetical protein